MRTIVFRVWDLARFLGWRALWVLPAWVVRRDFTVLVKDMHSIPPLPAPDRVHCTLLTEAEVTLPIEIEPTMTETEIRKRWEEGQECLLGWVGGRPAGFHWYSTRSTYLPFLRRTLHLADGDSYAGYTYTHPAFRGRGVHPRMSLTGLHRARDQGARRSISLIAAWNRAALHVNLRKSERRVVGRIGFWNLGLKRFYDASGDVHLDGDGGFRVLG